MLALKDSLEIFSDACGFVGGILLVLPAYRILTQRRAVDELYRKIARKYSNSNAPVDIDLGLVLGQISSEIDAYNPKYTTWTMVGISCVVASFAFKLLFHWLSKF